MQLEPISWERLTEALAERIAETKAADGSLRLRVAVDGPPRGRARGARRPGG